MNSAIWCLSDFSYICWVFMSNLCAYEFDVFACGCAPLYVCHLLMSDSGFVFRSISKAMDELRTGPTFDAAALDRLKIYVTECIDKYGDDYQYSTDPRLLKIWILYVTEWFLDVNSDVTPMSCSIAYFSALLLCVFFAILGGCDW